MLSDEKFEANCNCGYIIPLHVIVFWNGQNILKLVANYAKFHSLKNLNLVSVWGLCPQTPASGIYYRWKPPLKFLDPPLYNYYEKASNIPLIHYKTLHEFAFSYKTPATDLICT